MGGQNDPLGRKEGPSDTPIGCLPDALPGSDPTVSFPHTPSILEIIVYLWTVCESNQECLCMCVTSTSTFHSGCYSNPPKDDRCLDIRLGLDPREICFNVWVGERARGLSRIQAGCTVVVGSCLSVWMCVVVQYVKTEESDTHQLHTPCWTKELCEHVPWGWRPSNWQGRWAEFVKENIKRLSYSVALTGENFFFFTIATTFSIYLHNQVTRQCQDWKTALFFFPSEQNKWWWWWCRWEYCTVTVSWRFCLIKLFHGVRNVSCNTPLPSRQQEQFNTHFSLHVSLNQYKPF